MSIPILIKGGTNFPFENYLSSNTLHLCDLTAKRWKALSPVCKADTPLKSYGQAFCVDSAEEMIYVCGGIYFILSLKLISNTLFLIIINNQKN